ncbi:2-dehydropantoate 2-reductase [Desulfosarcina widdelii]|uniref:2-dehydropantoate 2-reductase n=1 Tax=Desulfosarcina widdelii TaxID=947919 RepID=A0A5K7Z8F7_9BACT|nr:2-dehydropantoate 2-reductase [Desulfosarcina widdelii]BBO76975.1 2-dehydropantoate 2-reductase [Desulfosarcina widdelii]
MEPIRNIAIVGAGAMGAAYAAMFSDAVGFNVSFVARGTRYEQLKHRSMTVNERLYNIGVIHPDKVSTPADLVIVALKHHHLADAVSDIAALAGPDTAILSVMNGLESEETIGAVCGMDKLVYAIAIGIDAVHENRRFTYANPGKIVFGPTADDNSGPDLERIREALDRAGIPNEVPPNILRAMWWKFMVNVGTNQASAVLRAPYGVFRSSPDARGLMRSLMEEVVALAPKAGIDLGTGDIDEWERILMTLSPTGKTSMLQDVEAGRKTEVELFAGRVVELGRKYNIPTPVNATVQRIIKVIESQSGH